MPFPLEVPDGVFKNEEGRWVRYCPSCNAEVNHLRRNYCIWSHNIKQPCKRCSNINNHPSGMVGAVRLAWYESFYKSALTRGYLWELTPQFINELYEEQDGLCVLSGLSIGWSKVGWEHTASIDRIDNNIGYTVENVQLVHKKINMMRGSLTIDEFLNLCSSVSDKVKW
jgi:hypothetical protein